MESQHRKLRNRQFKELVWSPTGSAIPPGATTVEDFNAVNVPRQKQDFNNNKRRKVQSDEEQIRKQDNNRRHSRIGDLPRSTAHSYFRVQ